MGNEITIEEKKKKVRDFRPIDDAFFEVLADDTGFCQEMLRILLDDEELIVEEVIVQSSERNIYGRSVRLDALCTFEDGKKCNVEVQRSDDDDHLRRVRSVSYTHLINEKNYINISGFGYYNDCYSDCTDASSRKGSIRYR